MKRIFSVLMIVACALPIIAQQRLYTTDGSQKKVNVIGITDTHIVYSNNKELNMPYDSIAKRDVYNILFENGSFMVITPSNSVPDKGSILSLPANTLQFNGEKIVSYGGKTISESEWLALASAKGVIDTYERGKTLRRVGTPIWATGVGCIVGGGVCMLAGFQNESKIATIIGESLAIFGAPLVLVGVPLHCVGSHLKEKSYAQFNQSNTVSLNLQSSANGLGIALSF